MLSADALKKTFACVMCFVMILTTTPKSTFAQAAPSDSSSSYSGQGAPLSSSELQQLVAPIALYPDALVAQVLGAATFPDQVAYANDWVQQHPNMSSSDMMQAVNQQPWDPSIKALTQFPSVLADMNKNITWTSSLGEAYHTQTADVMSAIQVLRAQAKAAGNLKSGSQITVVQQSPQTIVIQPANPQVVYVPQYNPAVVYGTPYVTPGYSTGAMVATGLLAFGAGIAVGAAISGGGCCGWGYSAWNCNWHGGAVVYGGGAYYGNAAWHGGYYGSGATAYGPNGYAHAAQGYNPSTGTYARGGTVSTPYGSSSAGRAYNPYTGASAATHQTSNAYGNYGSSVVSKNGETAYTQHQTTANGSAASMQTSNGGKAVAGSNANGSYAAGQSANGNKYASANGNQYKNTGSGWQKDTNGSWNSVQKPSTSSANGYGQRSGSEDKSAFGGSGGGWQSRQDSARGAQSRGGGGGWGGGGGGGFRGRR